MLGCSAGWGGFQAALVERAAAKFCKEKKKRKKINFKEETSEKMSQISGVGEEAAAWPVSPDANI